MDPPGRELWSSGIPREAREAALTWPERLWVYNVFALLPVYAAATAAAAVLDGPHAWKNNADFSAWAVLTIWVPVVGMLHLFNWGMEMKIAGRRAQAVLSRPLRHGRHVWAIASGDTVRVYRIERDRNVVPHLWPVALGIRGRVDGGREFFAEHEAEAAFDYVAELERASRPHPAAAALAHVINERTSVSD